MRRLTPYWAASLFFAALVLGKLSMQTGFTSLIRFGENWREHRHEALLNLPIATVHGSNGYDGQFYAQLALDPLLLNPAKLTPAIDAPAYRARRMLVPATAAMLGLGNPWWTLQAYALVNVLCWFVLSRLLYRQIGGADWMSFARWAGCMFSLGVLDSVRQSLVDLPALLLLTLAVTAAAQARAGRSVFWQSLANLTKETSLLGTLAIHCDKSLNPFSWKRTAFPLLLAALPLALWSFYVRQRFAGTPDNSGLGNLTWPLIGLFDQVNFSLHQLFLGDWDGRYSFCLIAVLGFSVQVWTLWRHRQPSSSWWRMGTAYSILLLFLGSWVWSGYWAVCRAVLPLTLAFNLLLPANRFFWLLWIAGNLTLLHGVWRFL